MDVRYGFSFFVLLSFIWEGVYVFLGPSLLRRDFIDKVFRVVALEEGLVDVVSSSCLVCWVLQCVSIRWNSDLMQQILCTVGWLLL